MLSWINREVKKTEKEKEFERLKSEYLKEFEKEFPTEWGDSDMQKAIDEMKECLELGVEKKPHGFDTSGGKVY